MSYLKEAYALPKNEYYELDRNKKAKTHPQHQNNKPITSAKGINSKEFWERYPNYDDYESYEVWDAVGGSVGKLFREENSCAVRVAYALNMIGNKITKISGIEDKRFFKNDDGNIYIVSAFYLRKYLKRIYGEPEDKLVTKQDQIDFTSKLKPNQCGIAIGVFPNGYGHCAILKKGYEDPHTPYSIMDVWYLSDE